MKKLNYLALGAIAMAVFSILLPWVQVSGASGTYDISESFQPLTISGISIGYGIIGLLVALLGGYMAYKEYKWSFIAGIVNVIDGYGYLRGWFGAGTHDSGNYGDATSRSTVDFKLGLYLFILASLAFIFFTLKYFLSKKKADIWQPDTLQQAETVTSHVTSHHYQPSNIQTMTASSSETPVNPEPTETPKVPEPLIETPTETPTATPTVPEPVEEVKEPVVPIVEVPSREIPNPPVQAIIPEPAPVIPQAPKVTATPPQPPYEPVKKKSATAWIFGILLVLVLGGAAAYMLTNNSSQQSMNKTEQSINDEKNRLQVVVSEVNQAVIDKKYDEALLKVNSINWLFEPDNHKGYVEQYNNERENLRHTIEQLKTNQSSDDRKQATEKANDASLQTEQKGDSIQ